MPLRVSSYNVGCLSEDAFASKELQETFRQKLEEEVAKLADENDVMCFRPFG